MRILLEYRGVIVVPIISVNPLALTCKIPAASLASSRAKTLHFTVCYSGDYMLRALGFEVFRMVDREARTTKEGLHEESMC